MKGKEKEKQEQLPDPDLQIQQEVGIQVEKLAALYVLDSVKGFGPQKFKQFNEARLSAEDIVRDPGKLPTKGKPGDKLRAQLETNIDHELVGCRSRAVRQIYAAHRYGGKIVTYGNAWYPQNVYSSNNPVPILYVRGSLEVLTHLNVVACVGSRKTRSPYGELLSAFVREACEADFAVVSGFALGADTIGHTGAQNCSGRTICCMPGGLDRPFPPENKALWKELLSYSSAVFVSEFAYGTVASSLTLRKRNKLIVAFAKGVLIGQSSLTGGAMNAYRFALEQKKSVATFAPDQKDDTSGNDQINKDRKFFDAVFPIPDPAREEYKKWLLALSSST